MAAAFLSGDLPRGESSGRVPGTTTSRASNHDNSVAAVLLEARDGVLDRLGPLLESYRNYLRLLATCQINGRLRVRVSPSDLVQETMLGAYRDFGQFRGQSERELLAWLRQILINRLHTFVQQHIQAGKRDLRREFSLEEFGAACARSTSRLEAGSFLADQGASPSARAMHRESAVALADHLEAIRPSYRQVIVLRNIQGMSFEEVAQEMDRTAGAVRMLWLRAIQQLRQRMQVETPAGTET